MKRSVDLTRCGCEIEEVFGDGDETTQIVYCPLHKAAPALLEALKEIVGQADRVTVPGMLSRDGERVLDKARAAIRQAKGEPA